MAPALLAPFPMSWTSAPELHAVLASKPSLHGSILAAWGDAIRDDPPPPILTRPIRRVGHAGAGEDQVEDGLASVAHRWDGLPLASTAPMLSTRLHRHSTLRL